MNKMTGLITRESEMKETLASLIEGTTLSRDQMHGVMQAFMSGQALPEQMAGVLVALAAKGETSTEIASAAEVLRTLMVPVDLTTSGPVVDIVGTGGDGANLFNVSTAACFVVAAAGVPVAKHGNVAVSSSSGSANLFRALGLDLSLSPERIDKCISETGIGFMFAPQHHPAMKYVAPIRKALGVRTLFNVLGPLINPARVKHHVIGVYAPELLMVMAEALCDLGSERALIVHSEDGLDELSIAAPSQMVMLDHGKITLCDFDPASVGISGSLAPLVVDSVEQSLALIQAAFAGEQGPAADIIALNAGAALYVAQRAGTIAEGVAMARSQMTGGGAAERVRQLRAFAPAALA